MAKRHRGGKKSHVKKHSGGKKRHGGKRGRRK